PALQSRLQPLRRNDRDRLAGRGAAARAGARRERRAGRVAGGRPVREAGAVRRGAEAGENGGRAVSATRLQCNLVAAFRKPTWPQRGIPGMRLILLALPVV